MSRRDLQIGDTVYIRASDGYDYGVKRATIIAKRGTLFGTKYLCRYKINWVDSGYVETFRKWRIWWRVQS